MGSRFPRPMVVADCAHDGDGALGGLLSVVDVLRADEREAGLVSGAEVSDGCWALVAAQALEARA